MSLLGRLCGVLGCLFESSSILERSLGVAGHLWEVLGRSVGVLGVFSKGLGVSSGFPDGSPCNPRVPRVAQGRPLGSPGEAWGARRTACQRCRQLSKSL